MKKVLKWIGIVIGGLIGLVILAVVGISLSANARLNRTYQVEAEQLSVPGDEASIAEGKRLASFYCAGCHGGDLAGTDFFNDPAIAVLDAPNLTSGEGGIGGQYRDEDWVLAIRHGVDTSGKPLFIMPSKDFYYLSDEDLGQMIAYMKSLPPADNDANDYSIGLMGKVLIGTGAFGDVLNVETIDHTGPRPDAPRAGVTAEYGEYLVNTFGCGTCHGADMSGGKSPDPAAPPGPDITSAGSVGFWSETDFIHQVRNRESEWMPFESLAKMEDDELKAVFVYLQSLSAPESAAK